VDLPSISLLHSARWARLRILLQRKREKCPTSWTPSAKLKVPHEKSLKHPGKSPVYPEKSPIHPEKNPV